MGLIFRRITSTLILGAFLAVFSCNANVENTRNAEPPANILQPSVTPSPSPFVPNLQKELLEERGKTTISPIGNFDFKNYAYDLPRGWENPEGSQITLVNGRVAPVSTDVTDEMSDEEKSERKAMRRIGLSHVTTRYMDVTGDGLDEAAVILKIETAGAAIPQIAYIFEWKDDEPNLIWRFRTGDRADGGLKDVRTENGLLIVELYGQDRFLLGEIETGRITGDEEQLCCPTYFTRTAYKWNGRSFIMQGKRLTYSVVDNNVPAVENMGDKINAAAAKQKK